MSPTQKALVGNEVRDGFGSLGTVEFLTALTLPTAGKEAPWHLVDPRRTSTATLLWIIYRNQMATVINCLQ